MPNNIYFSSSFLWPLWLFLFLLIFDANKVQRRNQRADDLWSYLYQTVLVETLGDQGDKADYKADQFSAPDVAWSARLVWSGGWGTPQCEFENMGSFRPSSSASTYISLFVGKLSYYGSELWQFAKTWSIESALLYFWSKCQGFALRSRRAAMAATES